MMNQNKKGKTTFKKPAWVVSAGLILFLILGMTFNNSTQTTDKIEDNSVASTTEKNEATKKAKTLRKRRRMKKRQRLKQTRKKKLGQKQKLKRKE